MPKREKSIVSAVILACSFQKWKCYFQDGLQEEQIFRGGRGWGRREEGREGRELKNGRCWKFIFLIYGYIQLLTYLLKMRVPQQPGGFGFQTCSDVA